MKDGEGINQKTYIHNPWTQTTTRGLAEGGEKVELGGGEKRENIVRTTVIA